MALCVAGISGGCSRFMADSVHIVHALGRDMEVLFMAGGLDIFYLSQLGTFENV